MHIVSCLFLNMNTALLNMARLGDKPTVELVNGRITFVYNLTFLRILWNAVMSTELCIEGCSRESLNTSVGVCSLNPYRTNVENRVSS